ncbi:DUF3152 domain-containing protein [Streptomyces sp. NPDC048623]|uniref:DUF3152 domain-containing protein n=1 Tax=Streptomyces sp. NPDC048623 TaxID=3155761 RepID=UPI00344728F3
MGRHSRKGPAAAPVADTGRREAARPGPGTGRRRRGEDQQPPAPEGPWQAGQAAPQYPAAGRPQAPGGLGPQSAPQRAAAPGGPRSQAGGFPNPGRQQVPGAPGPRSAPQRPAGPGGPRHSAGQQPPVGPRPQAGGPQSQRSGGTRPPAAGQPPRPYGPQGSGGPGPGYATPPHGTPGYAAPGRAPAPVFDTPMHGTPRYRGPHDTEAVGESGVRGGHPVHDETVRTGSLFVPGPRREAVPRTPVAPDTDGAAEGAEETAAEPQSQPKPARGGGLGRTLTGVTAVAITTVLAVVVAGQVVDRESGAARTRAADGAGDRAGAESPASRSDEREARTPSAAPAAPPTYEQLMARQFPIDPKLTGPGKFDAVPGFDKAPGKGRKIRYRVDVEQGLGLDGALFAQAVQKTLNDPRSWAGQGEMTFERISSGDPDFVVTLASPGTTGAWCRKSGLDTTVDNVSCDSASTERVMVNAFRWAQGSETFGPAAMHAYRQMLINHEVGHRLGHNHVSCRTPGALAPVMQQQTKSLDIDGIKCRPNPWVHPGS